MRDLQNELEEMLNGFVEELLDAVSSMPEAAQPFASVKLSPEEQMQRYQEIRESPEQVAQLFRERGWESAIDYGLSMERRFKERENATVE